MGHTHHIHDGSGGYLSNGSVGVINKKRTSMGLDAGTLGLGGIFFFVTKKVGPPGGTRTHDRAVMITVFGVAGCSLYREQWVVVAACSTN